MKTRIHFAHGSVCWTTLARTFIEHLAGIEHVEIAPVRAAVGDAPVRAARGRLRRYAIGLDVIHAERWR